MRHETVIIRLPAELDSWLPALDVRLARDGRQVTEASSRFADWSSEWSDEGYRVWYMSDREAALTLPDLAREIWPTAQLVAWRIP